MEGPTHFWYFKCMMQEHLNIHYLLCIYNVQYSNVTHITISPPPLNSSSHYLLSSHLLSPSLTISSHYLSSPHHRSLYLTTSSHHLLTISHHLLSLSPLIISSLSSHPSSHHLSHLTISSHYLLSIHLLSPFPCEHLNHLPPIPIVPCSHTHTHPGIKRVVQRDAGSSVGSHTTQCNLLPWLQHWQAAAAENTH